MNDEEFLSAEWEIVLPMRIAYHKNYLSTLVYDIDDLTDADNAMFDSSVRMMKSSREVIDITGHGYGISFIKRDQLHEFYKLLGEYVFLLMEDASNPFIDNDEELNKATETLRVIESMTSDLIKTNDVGIRTIPKKRQRRDDLQSLSAIGRVSDENTIQGYRL